jgi:argininosuccinate lyase
LDLSPAWEDVHTWIEGHLRALVGEASGRLHTARSRNDQVALDLRMFARDAILDQTEALGELQMALVQLANRNADAIMPGYTHLQRAQPVLLAHPLLAYGEMLERDTL